MEPIKPQVTTSADGVADPSELWLKIARENGFEDFLMAANGFGRSTSSRRRWANRNRPGIYFWLTENGEAYIGQSVRPLARLRQHQRHHGDITHAAFQRCPRQGLNALEQKLVEIAGRHFTLRNIKFAVSTASPVALDQLISPAEQALFVAGGDLEDGDWPPLDDHVRLQSRKFEQFLAHRDSASALEALQLFVCRAIPKPAATEAKFWSVSLFADRCFVRVNAGHQEVFTYDARANRVELFSDRSLSWLGSWRTSYQVPSWVNWVRPAHLDQWLAGERLLSCRRLVVRLMRHTQALNSGSHCPQLLRHPIPPA